MACWLGLVFASSPERMDESRKSGIESMSVTAATDDENYAASPAHHHCVEGMIASLDVAPIDQGLYAFSLSEFQLVC